MLVTFTLRPSIFAATYIFLKCANEVYCLAEADERRDADAIDITITMITAIIGLMRFDSYARSKFFVSQSPRDARLPWLLRQHA